MSNKADRRIKKYHGYVQELKRVRDEYRTQNKQFVKILEFYAKNYDSGELARAALSAWAERIKMTSPLEKHYIEISNSDRAKHLREESLDQKWNK